MVLKAEPLTAGCDSSAAGTEPSFVEETVAKLNRGRFTRLAEERSALRRLPSCSEATHTECDAKVLTTSVVRISNRSSSVSSRLIGQRVKVREHADASKLYRSGQLVERMTRLCGEQDRRIDYRHVTWSR